MPAQLANPAVSGPLANPDADSFSNLAEYAFALEPFTINGNDEALAFSPADPASEGFLFTYTQRKNATDLFYQIEYSGDLNNPLWNLLTDPQEPNAAVDLGPVWQRTIAVPQHYPTREFLRLRLFQLTTPGQLPVLNDPPQNLTATLHEPFLDIDLAWIDRSNQETGYRIERRPDGSSSWTIIATTSSDIVSYRDRHLASNTLFKYRVTAILKTGGSGQPSSEVTVQTPFDTDGDNLPDTFELQIGTDPSDPDSDNDGLNDGYEVEHGTQSYGYANLGNGNTGSNVYGPSFAPLNADTDGNGIPDGEEDDDKDGLTNSEENELGTNPTKPDTDTDGKGDGEEMAPMDKYITLPRVPESHYAVLPIQEVTVPVDKTFVNDSGAIVWQQTTTVTKVYFWKPTLAAPVDITIPNAKVELKDFFPDDTVLLQYTPDPVASTVEFPLAQKCRTSSATWSQATGVITHPSLLNSPLVTDLYTRMNVLWQQMLPDARQAVNDDLQRYRGNTSVNDETTAIYQKHLTFLAGTFDPIAMSQKTEIVGSGECFIYPIGFDADKNIIAAYYQRILLSNTNTVSPFSAEISLNGLCKGSNGVYSLYDPTSNGSARPGYSDFHLDGQYRDLPAAEHSSITFVSANNRQGFVYGRGPDGINGIAGNGPISALPSAEGQLTNTRQANQPFPLVGVRLDYGESAVYRKENGVWKEWAYGIFNEDHPAWISDRLEMLLTDTPSIWRNGRAVELAGLVGEDSVWESISPRAISPTTGFIYGGATKTKNPDGTVIPQAQRKTYAVCLLPVEVGSKDRMFHAAIRLPDGWDGWGVKIKNETSGQDFGTYANLTAATPSFKVYNSFDDILTPQEVTANNIDTNQKLVVVKDTADPKKLIFFGVSDAEGTVKITFTKGTQEMGSATIELTQDDEMSGLLNTVDARIHSLNMPEVEEIQAPTAEGNSNPPALMRSANGAAAAPNEGPGGTGGRIVYIEENLGAGVSADQTPFTEPALTTRALIPIYKTGPFYNVGGILANDKVQASLLLGYMDALHDGGKDTLETAQDIQTLLQSPIKRSGELYHAFSEFVTKPQGTIEQFDMHALVPRLYYSFANERERMLQWQYRGDDPSDVKLGWYMFGYAVGFGEVQLVVGTAEGAGFKVVGGTFGKITKAAKTANVVTSVTKKATKFRAGMQRFASEYGAMREIARDQNRISKILFDEIEVNGKSFAEAAQETLDGMDGVKINHQLINAEIVNSPVFQASNLGDTVALRWFQERFCYVVAGLGTEATEKSLIGLIRSYGRLVNSSLLTDRIEDLLIIFKADTATGKKALVKSLEAFVDATDIAPVGEQVRFMMKDVETIHPNGYRISNYDPRFDPSGNPVSGSPQLGVHPSDGWYVSFDNPPNATSAKTRLQLPDNQTARYKLVFDTNLVKQNLEIPYGMQNQAEYFEPRARSFPIYGSGEASQALIKSSPVPIKEIFEDLGAGYVKIWPQ